MADGFVDISAIGLDELEKDFARLKFSVQKKIMRDAMAKAIQPITSHALRLVPVDTGQLKRSIYDRVVSRARLIIGQSVAGEGGEMFKGNEYYAGMVEYGHRIGKRSKGIANRERQLAKLRDISRTYSGTFKAEQAMNEEKRILRLYETRTGFVAANPFMRPALEQGTPEAMAILEKEVTEGVANYIDNPRSLRATVKSRIAKAGAAISKRLGKASRRYKKLSKAVGKITSRVQKSARKTSGKLLPRSTRRKWASRIKKLSKAEGYGFLKGSQADL